MNRVVLDEQSSDWRVTTSNMVAGVQLCPLRSCCCCVPPCTSETLLTHVRAGGSASDVAISLVFFWPLPLRVQDQRMICADVVAS